MDDGIGSLEKEAIAELQHSHNQVRAFFERAMQAAAPAPAVNVRLSVPTQAGSVIRLALNMVALQVHSIHYNHLIVMFLIILIDFFADCCEGCLERAADHMGYRGPASLRAEHAAAQAF